MIPQAGHPPASLGGPLGPLKTGIRLAGHGKRLALSLKSHCKSVTSGLKIAWFEMKKNEKLGA
jgi:hypothetical protein